MERAVVGDHLGGEECDADDNQEECVEKGASDEETGPEIMSFYLLFDVVMDGETDPDLSENIGQTLPRDIINQQTESFIREISL